MELLATKKFERSYAKASPALMSQVRHKVDFVDRLHHASPPLARHLETVAGVRSSSGLKFVEIDVAGAFRIVASQDADRLVLLRFGPKRIVPDFANRYRDEATMRELAAATPVPDGFATRGSGSTDEWLETATEPRDRPGRPGWNRVERRTSERLPSWAWWLDEAQTEVAEALLSSIERRLIGDGDAPLVYVVLGGAGTGKTCVLVNLWMRLAGGTGLSPETWAVEFQLGLRVQQAVERHGCPRIGRPAGPADLVLLDDPVDVQDIADAVREAARTGTPLVVALDPLQYLASAQLREIAGERLAQHWLTTCYRQKKSVAWFARSLVRSGKHVDDAGRIKLSRWERKAAKVKLTNLGGIFEHTDSSTLVDLQGDPAVGTVRESLRLVLEDSPVRGVEGILVVVDDMTSPSSALSPLGAKLFVEEAFSSGLPVVAIEYILLSESRVVRGLEYAAVILFTQDRRYFDRRKLPLALSRERVAHIRTVVTRARDALCVVEVVNRSHKRTEPA